MIPKAGVVSSPASAVSSELAIPIGTSYNLHARRAVGSLVRNPLFSSILSALATWIFFYAAVMKWLFGTKNALEVLKLDLNRPDLLPWTRDSTPRLYLCSRNDQVVAFYEVEAHAEDAKKAGFDVRFEAFEDTPHVSHAKYEPERYWGAVKAVWNAAVEGEGRLT
ncbi:hypothetical protein C0991_001966 [Blastosporella zonata]|nr:hypothetical protein C0991_001966 [Blastosporella zonata]